MNKLSYLSSLTEEFFYKNYMPLWRANIIFNDLSQEDAIMLLNIKHRALSEPQERGQVPIDEGLRQLLEKIDQRFKNHEELLMI
jgi:hypothetical protein